MEVDEARGDDEPRGIDDLPAVQMLSRDRDDPSGADPDVANVIEARFRIDHATIRDDQVVDEGRLWLRGAYRYRKRDLDERDREPASHLVVTRRHVGTGQGYKTESERMLSHEH